MAAIDHDTRFLAPPLLLGYAVRQWGAVVAVFSVALGSGYFFAGLALLGHDREKLCFSLTGD
ncbi:MAG: hypothetical protein PHT84_03855 [Candidatus Pacebacteria bacterium]|nr:hypothetical protein [Candidatus Paceibacterota bacterium]